jgi:tripartite-type tricarboxylate transporter receptor subunit TctC
MKPPLSSTHTTRRRFVATSASVLSVFTVPALVLPNTARAQSYPTKPIHVIVPYAAGGGADANARLLGQAMEKQLGQILIVENRPGASGIVGEMGVLQAPADGYTMLFDTFPFAVNAVLRKLPFDPMKDLLPVSQAINMPTILVVPASAPYKTLKEMIDYAHANPGKMNFASYGAGGSAHLAGEMLRREAGVEWTHIPYKGGAPAITDLLAGQVSAYFANPISGLAYVQSGKLRALATTGAKRMEELPEVPTVKESGYPNFEIVEWNGFFVAKGTPQPVIDKLSDAVRRAVQDPAVRKRLIGLGIEPVGNSPQEFAAFLQSQITRWAALVKTNHITID